jgi:hypothetical protein
MFRADELLLALLNANVRFVVIGGIAVGVAPAPAGAVGTSRTHSCARAGLGPSRTATVPSCCAAEKLPDAACRSVAPGAVWREPDIGNAADRATASARRLLLFEGAFHGRLPEPSDVSDRTL